MGHARISGIFGTFIIFVILKMDALLEIRFANLSLEEGPVNRKTELISANEIFFYQLRNGQLYVDDR